MAEHDRIKIIAHRGKGPTSKLSGKGTSTEDVPPQYTPENTLKAFRQAIEEGADGIEFDVYISKDGIPVITHDDALNVHVIGADRTGKDLGLISEKNLEEIKQYNVGQGETIPTLQETIELFIESNTKRSAKSLPPLIMNVELKGKGSAVPSFLLLNKYINDGLINKEYVVYCSFRHDELKRIRELDPDAKLSPAIQSTFLWGKDNVIEPGFFIPMNVELPKTGIEYLQNLHKELNVTAFDPVLFDIDGPLVDFVKSLGVSIYASTSDFRDFSNKAFLQLLININKEVPIYFKTDEPKQIHQILEEYEEIMSLDLSSVIVLTHEETLSIREEQIKRIPKVNQPENTLQLDTQKIQSTADKFNSIMEKLVVELGDELKLFITNPTSSSNQNDHIVKIIEAFGYLEEYIPKILSLKQENVTVILNVLKEVSGIIHNDSTLPTHLKLQLEIITMNLEEQEIKLLNSTDKTIETLDKVHVLENNMAFFQKDILVSGAKLLNDITIKSFSPDSSTPLLTDNLTNSIEVLKNALHIDQYPHPSIVLNDNVITNFLNDLSIKMQNHQDISIQDLKFVVLINNELQSILTEFQQSDQINELHWNKSAEEVAKLNEPLVNLIELHTMHDDL